MLTQSLTLLGVLGWVPAYPTTAPRMRLMVVPSRTSAAVHASRTRAVVVK